VLDDMREVSHDEELPDLVYVDVVVDPKDIQDLAALAPYHGPAWYCRPVIEYCLHTHKLTWADLKWGITASGRLDGCNLRAALDVMEAAWADVALGTNSSGRRHENHAKRSFNTWVGITGMAGAVNLRSSISFDWQDRPAGTTMMRQDAYGVKGLFEYTRVQEVVDSGTSRPIYDWCVGVEHTRVAQAHQAAMAVYKMVRMPCPLLHLTGDGFIFERSRKRVTVDKLTSLIGLLP
jgi:hypothetical protein